MVTAVMADNLKGLNYILTTDIVPCWMKNLNQRAQILEAWRRFRFYEIYRMISQDDGGRIDEWLLKDTLIFLQDDQCHMIW